MSDATVTDGLIDTNVFIHALLTDEHSAECQRLLNALQQGDIHATLEPLVLHELSYSLPRMVKQMTRQDVGAYLLTILSWPGIQANKDLLTDAVERWWRTPRLGFTDAYLAVVATRRECVVFSKNVRELVAQGATVPDPLPPGLN